MQCQVARRRPLTGRPTASEDSPRLAKIDTPSAPTTARSRRRVALSSAMAPRRNQDFNRTAHPFASSPHSAETKSEPLALVHGCSTHTRRSSQRTAPHNATVVSG